MQIKKTPLPNGLRVITARLPYLRSVSIAVAVGGGARYETKENAGVSHLLEHLLLEDQDAIGGIEGVGGDISGLTFEEDIGFSCWLPSRYFAELIPLFFGMLFRPSFSEEVFEKERRIMLNEYREILDDPGWRLGFLFIEELFRRHPLGNFSPSAHLRGLPGISFSAFKRFYQRQFVSGNIVIAAVGNVEHRELLGEVKAVLSDVAEGEVPPAPLGKVEPGTPRTVNVEVDSSQVYFALGCETVSIHHPERRILDLIAWYLGQGMSSRLFVKVRKEAGLVYDIGAVHDVHMDTGYLVIKGSCAPESKGRVLEIVNEELAALRAGRVENLSSAKERCAGRLEGQLEDPMYVAVSSARQELFKGEILTPDQVADEIRAIPLQDVIRLSNEVLDPGKFLLVTVGPESE